MLVIKFIDGRIKSYGMVRTCDIQDERGIVYINYFDGFMAYESDYAGTNYSIDIECDDYQLKYVEWIMIDGVAIWREKEDEAG